MPVVNGYTTLADFKDWVTDSTSVDDAKIERAITAASRAIDNFCLRQFWQVTEDRVFDAAETWLLDIDDADAITAVTADDDADGTFETTWTSADYQLLPLNPTAAPEKEPYTQIRAIGSLRFPRPSVGGRLGLVKVSATWGWNAVPTAVEQACLLVANRVFWRKESPQGVAGASEFGIVRISSREDPDAVRYLTPYIRDVAFA